jgi:hypothetical protein
MNLLYYFMNRRAVILLDWRLLFPVNCHAQSLAATNRVTEQLSWMTVEIYFFVSCSIIPFLACHHSITNFEINAFLNQNSYRLLKFVSDLVSIFDAGWFCFTSQLPSARVSGCRPSL